MTFHFDIQKLLAAVGYVLELSGGKIDFIHLIKTLYSSDRRSLIEYGRTITGDRFASLPNGPVVEMVEKMTRGDAPKKLQKTWDEYFTCKENYKIGLKQKPDQDFLSEGERLIIKGFYYQYKTMSARDLIKHVHNKKSFPEWSNPRGSGKTFINVEAILRFAGKTNQEIASIKEENEQRASLHQLLKRGRS